MEDGFFAGAFGEDDANDGGNDFAGFLDGDGVADANVFSAQFILIVQGGAFDDGAREEDGFQLRDGCEGAGAPDLDGDGLEFRFGLLGGVFVGD